MQFGYQAVYDASFFDAIGYAKDNRFDYVSFDLNVPRFYIDDLSGDELGRIRGCAEAAGVGLAFHTPGDNISLYSDYPSIRSGIIEHFSRIIAAAESLGARHVTVHPGIHPSLKQVRTHEDDFIKEYESYFGAVLRENLLRLADHANDVLVCVENFHFTQITMRVIEGVLNECDRIFLTWDIAKTTDDSVETFMRRWEHRIREVHAHDIIRGLDRSHQTIGDGYLDFRPCADLIARPDVATTIEVRPREAATISRDRLIEILGLVQPGAHP